MNINKKPIVVKNKDFQTIIVRVAFPFFEDEKNFVKLSMLPNMLAFMDEKYPSEEEFLLNRKKNYILSTNCSKMSFGDNTYLCFSLVIPDVKALGFDNLEKQFEFFSEMIYKPKIINNGFDEFEFNRELTNTKLGIDEAYKKPKTYQLIKVLEAIDDYGLLSRLIYNHSELLDEITPQNLYDLYKEIISTYRPFIFVFGNITNDKVNYLADKYLYKDIKYKNSIELSYNHFLIPKNTDVNIIEEKKDFKDSYISFVYKVKDMSGDDFTKLKLVRALLTSQSSRLLNKKLRDDNDLVYSSGALTYMKFGVFQINAFINKNNKDIVISKIKEVMNDLKNPDIISEYLENIKNRKRINLIGCLDDKFALLADKVSEVLKIEKNMQDEYQEMLKVSALDIAQFMDRLVLDTIYYIEEADNDKD